MSPRLHGFLDKMLVRDPAQRATAAELLHHPFLNQAGDPHLLVPFMRQFHNSPTWYIGLLAKKLQFSTQWDSRPADKALKRSLKLKVDISLLLPYFYWIQAIKTKEKKNIQRLYSVSVLRNHIPSTVLPFDKSGLTLNLRYKQ